MASIKLLVLFAILMVFGSQLTTAAPPHEKECVENLIGCYADHQCCSGYCHLMGSIPGNYIPYRICLDSNELIGNEMESSKFLYHVE